MFRQSFVAIINSLHGNYTDQCPLSKGHCSCCKHMANIRAQGTMSLIPTVATNTANKF